MKDLVLKEWQERRRLFFIVTGLTILIHVVLKFLVRGVGYVFFTRVAYYIYPLGLAIFLGNISFQRGFIKKTKDVYRKSPWELRKIFLIRYFSGLIIMYFTLLISYFHSLLIFRFRLFHLTPYGWRYDYVGITQYEILPLILLTGILYTANCLIVILTRTSIAAIICSLFLLYYFILILASLPGI